MSKPKLTQESARSYVTWLPLFIRISSSLYIAPLVVYSSHIPCCFSNIPFFFFFSYLRALVLGLTSVWNILPSDILFDKFLMFPNILCFLILLTSEVFPRLCYLIMKSASISHFWHLSHCYAFLYMLYVYIHNFLYNVIHYTFFCLLVFIFKDVIPFWILSFNPKGQGNCFVHC